MTDIVPAGPLAMPVYLLRRMVALSPTFAAACLEIGETEPINRTFFKDAEGTEPKPVACINHDRLGYQMYAAGGQNYLRASGDLFLWIAQDVAAEDFDDDRRSFMKFANFFGQVIDEVVALSGADQTTDLIVPDSHLSIINVDSLIVSLNNEDEWHSLGKFWWGGVAIGWGDGQ